MSLLTFVCYPTLSIALFAASPSPQGDDESDDSVLKAVQQAVEQMIPLLKTKGITRVHVGAFTSPKGTSTGAELQEKFLRVITTRHKELMHSKLDYQVVIRGRLERLEKPIGVRIACQLFNANEMPLEEVAGQALASQAAVGQANSGGVDSPKPVETTKKPLEFTGLVDGVEAILRINGITAEVGSGGAVKQLEEIEKIQSKGDPSFITQENGVKASEKSPFGVEILLVGADNALESVKPSKVEALSGGTFVAIPNGSRYIIRLHNYSDKQVTAKVSIDGLNTMVFSKLRSPDACYVIPPKKSGDVKGWDYDNESSLGFKKVAGYPGSAMEELLVTNEYMGQICVQFSEFFAPNSSLGKGTGVGGLVDDKKVEVPGRIGDLLASVVIRYER